MLRPVIVHFVSLTVELLYHQMVHGRQKIDGIFKPIVCWGFDPFCKQQIGTSGPAFTSHNW